MAKPLLHSGKWFAFTLALLSVLSLALPLRADIHPVPLEKTADSLKCLECHNSDDNREFGGTGPNGPHGSTYPHLLERNYQIGQSAAGGAVTNLYPNPDQSPQGPYALCAKCHNLAIVLTAASWTNHPNHVAQDGFSCSICHHGARHGSDQLKPYGRTADQFRRERRSAERNLADFL